MASESPESADCDVVPVLERIADEIRVLRDVLDEIRTDFQWAIRNGRTEVGQPTRSAPSENPPLKVTAGDTVEFEYGGEPAIADVLKVNLDRHLATVRLIPNGTEMEVHMDTLSKVPARTEIRRGYEPTFDSSDLPSLPEPGSLF